jgi:hypothetical protein
MRVYAVLVGLVFAVVSVAADNKPPTEEQLAGWFDDLTPGLVLVSQDSSDVVLMGVFHLIDHPKEAVPFLRKKLKPVDGPEAKAIGGWVKDFLGDDAKARDTAEAELRKHRDDFLVTQKLLQAGNATDSQPLRRRIAAVVWKKPIEEVKEGEAEPPPIAFRPLWVTRFVYSQRRSGSTRSITDNASELAPFDSEIPRARRALLVLERIGTPEAVEALKEIAEGRAELPTTVAAKEALGRLKAK